MASIGAARGKLRAEQLAAEAIDDIHSSGAGLAVELVTSMPRDLGGNKSGKHVLARWPGSSGLVGGDKIVASIFLFLRHHRQIPVLLSVFQLLVSFPLF